MQWHPLLAELLRPIVEAYYIPWVLTLHEKAWKEVRAMSRAVDVDEVPLNWKTVAKYVGLSRLIEQIGLPEMVNEFGLKRVIDEVGLKRVIDEVGLKRVIDEVGVERVIQEVGVERLLASMTPAQRRELKRRLR